MLLLLFVLYIAQCMLSEKKKLAELEFHLTN